MRITVFSAHPDDAEFAMGGVLLMLSKAHDVTNVILARGEAGTHGTPAQREEEGYHAGRIGGYDVRFLNHKDTRIEDSTKSIEELALVIRELQPRVIFTPYHTNNGPHTDGRAHHDHSALGQIVRKAARIAKFKNAPIREVAHAAERIIYYMVPRRVEPSFTVDVSSTIDELPALWKAHESQTALKSGAIIDYLLAERRAVGHSCGVEYAEAFITEPLVLTIHGFLPEE